MKKVLHNQKQGSTFVVLSKAIGVVPCHSIQTDLKNNSKSYTHIKNKFVGLGGVAGYLKSPVSNDLVKGVESTDEFIFFCFVLAFDKRIAARLL